MVDACDMIPKSVDHLPNQKSVSWGLISHATADGLGTRSAIGSPKSFPHCGVIQQPHLSMTENYKKNVA